jgi:atrial natriuretic peptide receptor A
MGPVCPYVLAPVARYAGVWNVPILTTGGQANTFRAKEQYPLLTTLGGAYEQFAAFFTKLLERYDW